MRIKLIKSGNVVGDKPVEDFRRKTRWNVIKICPRNFAIKTRLSWEGFLLKFSSPGNGEEFFRYFQSKGLWRNHQNSAGFQQHQNKHYLNAPLKKSKPLKGMRELFFLEIDFISFRYKFYLGKHLLGMRSCQTWRFEKRKMSSQTEFFWSSHVFHWLDLQTQPCVFLETAQTLTKIESSARRLAKGWRSRTLPFPRRPSRSSIYVLSKNIFKEWWQEAFLRRTRLTTWKQHNYWDINASLWHDDREEELFSANTRTSWLILKLLQIDIIWEANKSKQRWWKDSRRDRIRNDWVMFKKLQES